MLSCGSIILKMKDVKLLDCTLRDGGYVNDWNFGHSTITYVFERLVKAGINIIEIGFLDERREFDVNRTIQPNTSCFDKIFSGCVKGDSLIVAMIDYGTCGIDNIMRCDETLIDGIRIIFKKPKMREAVEFASQVKDKGYKVFLQLVSITSYDDNDMRQLIDIVNEVEPYAVSMVDTYGLMHKEAMSHYFSLLNTYLKLDIMIGYHSHNNFQLGYANEIEMLQKPSERSLIVDGTVYGIGKSAGNAPLELLAMNMNENYGCSFDIDQILEIIDVNIMKIYKDKCWGYSLLFFLSASNECHPNYINYLLNKHNLSIKSINDISKNIRSEKKLDYDQAYIEDMYKQYQEKTIFESNTIQQMRYELADRKILLIGPGSSLIYEKDKIKNFINKNHPVIISVNCVPDEFTIDYAFFGNAKRYSMMFHALKGLKKCKLIATSNISSVDEPFEYVFSYDSLTDDNPDIQDNAFIMVLNAMIKVGVKSVSLAGFDGFIEKNDQNYYDDYMDITADYNRLKAVNQALKARLREMGNDILLEFLTDSLYKE